MEWHTSTREMKYVKEVWLEGREIIKDMQKAGAGVIVYETAPGVYAMPVEGGMQYLYASEEPPIETCRIENWANIALDALTAASQRVDYIRRMAKGERVK